MLVWAIPENADITGVNIERGEWPTRQKYCINRTLVWAKQTEAKCHDASSLVRYVLCPSLMTFTWTSVCLCLLSFSSVHWKFLLYLDALWKMEVSFRRFPWPSEAQARSGQRVQIKSRLFQELSCSSVPKGSLSAIVIWDSRDAPACPSPYHTYMQISEVHTLNFRHSRKDPCGLFPKYPTVKKPSVFSRHPSMSKSHAPLKVTSDSVLFSASPHLSYKLQRHSPSSAGTCLFRYVPMLLTLFHNPHPSEQPVVF